MTEKRLLLVDPTTFTEEGKLLLAQAFRKFGAKLEECELVSSVNDAVKKRPDKLLSLGMDFPPTYFPNAIKTVCPGVILNGNEEQYTDLLRAVEKFVTGSLTIEIPKLDIVVAKDKDEALGLLQVYSGARYLSCDLETTGLSPLIDRVLALGIGALTADGAKGHVLVLKEELLSDEQVKGALCGLFDSNIFWIGHNWKFDQGFIWKLLGPEVAPRYVRDTALMSYILDERVGHHHGLKSLARYYCNAPEYDINIEKWLQLPEWVRDYQELYTYLAYDCYYTLKLYFILEAKLVGEYGDNRGLALCDGLLMPASLALAKIELTGIPMDKTKLNEAKSIERQAQKLQEKLSKLTGIASFSPLSWKDVASFLGTERANEAILRKALREHEDKREAIALILEYRNLHKLQSMFQNYLEHLGPDDRVHPSFSLLGTVSGRLSCHSPNMQNVPREIRDCVIAPDGHVLIEADYSQLELRIAAYYSQDENLSRVFRENLDLHTQTARAIFKTDQITPEQRTLAKAVNFGILYGISAKGISNSEAMDYLIDQLGMMPWSEEDLDQFIRQTLQAYPKLLAWMNRVTAQAKSGFVETPFHRRRRFPLVTRKNAGRVKRQAINTPIQSMASDLCLLAVTKLVKRLPPGAEVILTVHDSILILCDENLLDTIRQMVHNIMIKEITDYYPVLLDVHIKVGKSWGTMKEV